MASFCLTEPDAGSDVSAMKTTAVRKGDKWVLNGSKCFITNGEYANWYTVYAKTDKDAGHRGISCFIVPRDAGVVVDKHEDKMGQRASNTATISFNDVEIPLDHLVGEENKGFKIAMMTLDRTRPGVAAMGVGVGRAAMEMAIDYSKERVQFGVPIAMHEAIQFIIADMATKVHLGRLATYNSAVLLDQGKRNTIESSHAKRFTADSAMEITTDAVQVFGGYGFIKEYKVEKLMRDAKILQLYEGTAQIQRLVIARETLLPRRSPSPLPSESCAASWGPTPLRTGRLTSLYGWLGAPHLFQLCGVRMWRAANLSVGGDDRSLTPGPMLHCARCSRFVLETRTTGAGCCRCSMRRSGGCWRAVKVGNGGRSRSRAARAESPASVA